VATVVAFIAYPVSDLVASRRFYDAVLEQSGAAGDVARLRDHSVQFRGDIVETAVCRFIVAVDPDGSEFLIHHRKAAPDAPQTI
jgi:catechol 2,3-dioxygenase-like lactoylglutathione lyase family enzyme